VVCIISYLNVQDLVISILEQRAVQIVQAVQSLLHAEHLLLDSEH